MNEYISWLDYDSYLYTQTVGNMNEFTGKISYIGLTLFSHRKNGIGEAVGGW